MIGFSRGWTVAVGAAALLAGACQRQDDASRRQARSATDAAEQSSDRAAKAEKKAADERGDVKSAQKDVADKQQDLAKAQQKENKEVAEARGAEQQASQSAREAQQQTATAQQTTAEQGRQQAEAQKQQATASAAGTPSDTERIASGQVVSAKQDELVLRQGSGAPDLKLKVSPSTTVTMGGRQASVSELKEGTQVRAAYQQQGGDQQAIRIEALTGAAGSGPSNVGAPPADSAPPAATPGSTGTERR